MFNDPNIGERIQVDGNTYTFSEAPSAPGILYAEIGRKAKVYRLVNDERAFALKVFKTKYRSRYAVEQTQSILRYQEIQGLTVTQRRVITANEHARIIQEHPDFEFSILMPWVEGKSWFNFVTGKLPISRQQSVRLARALIKVIYDLESHDLAHCDLSSSNFIFSPDFCNVELIDIEDMFGNGLKEPPEKPKGTGGYSPNWARANGIWEAGADRFSTAILVCEILGWQFENIREASEGDAYFAEGEFGNKSKRFRLLCEGLEEIHPQLTNLFKTTWYSESLEECPKIAQWKEVLDTLGEPEIEIAPSLIDFGVLEGGVNSQLPVRDMIIRNIGSGTLAGQVITNVPWLSITPQDFSCREGFASEHSIALLADYPERNLYKNKFDNVISIHDGNSTIEIACTYEIKQRSKHVNPFWIFFGAISFFVMLVVTLSQASGPGSNPPISEPATPTSHLPDVGPTTEVAAPVQEMPVYTASLQYSSNLEQWNALYYRPMGIELSQTKSSNNWIEPPTAGLERYFGVLPFGATTEIGVILDVLDEIESRMIFSLDEDLDFSDNQIFYTSDQVLTEPLEFQIRYSDGSVEPYAIKAYYLTDRAPGELLFYRASLREGTLQIADQTWPIAIFDDNADGLYSDLENVEVKIDLNQDGYLDDDEGFYPLSPVRIDNTYYKVVEISPSGSQIMFQEAEFGQIAGTINDAVTGEPIRDAQITTYPLGLATSTNINGEYFIQVPEGQYWQIAVLETGHVPEYAYPQEPIAPGQTLELNVSLSRPSGITRGIVQLYEGDSYHFLAGTNHQYKGGDFYLSFSEGSPQFWANDYYQLGLMDLGYDPNIELDQITPPDSGYYMYGVDAIVDHVYVSLAKEGEAGHYVIFRVKHIEPGQYVEIEYYYD
jgi:serine/threonine protein kinase